ncbi:26S proteasome regulatory subunit 7A [Datura stramonium]|uniref:26S proteasome regulatory subunit 7A n=1 Tax=Datura stramonium TaxID=4076 RepID=A0ABS8S6D0_DATST|nr:26S proteasome regulatory subunit 7A [Datura stramonium]
MAPAAAADVEDEIKEEKNPRPLDEDDIALPRLCIKESDTGLAAPSQWDLVSDKQMMQEEQPLQLLIGINIKFKFPAPKKLILCYNDDYEEKPDVTYNDVGGCKEQIEKMREVVELPMLQSLKKFVNLELIPKGVLCYGPGTGKTLLARVLQTHLMHASFKYCVSLFRNMLVRGLERFVELFQECEVSSACSSYNSILLFADLIHLIQLYYALTIGSKVEFGLPDMESRTQIFKIHTRTMNFVPDIHLNFARLCPNSTGPVFNYIVAPSPKSVCYVSGSLETLLVRKIWTKLFDYVEQTILNASLRCHVKFIKAHSLPVGNITWTQRAITSAKRDRDLTG